MFSGPSHAADSSEKPRVHPADDKMDVDEATKDKDGKPEEKKDENEKDASPAEIAKKKLEKEKVGYELQNMSRVLPAQLKFISFPAGRYKPVKKVSSKPIP